MVDGRLRAGSISRVVTWAASAVAVVATIASIVTLDFRPLLLWIPYLAIVWANWFYNQIRIAPEGIHRGALRPSRRLIHWDEVEAIQEPTAASDFVTLYLAGNRVLTLTGVPADRAHDVGLIGGKELRAGARPLGAGTAKGSEIRPRAEAEPAPDLSAPAAAPEPEKGLLTSELSRNEKPGGR